MNLNANDNQGYRLFRAFTEQINKDVERVDTSGR